MVQNGGVWVLPAIMHCLIFPSGVSTRVVMTFGEVIVHTLSWLISGTTVTILPSGVSVTTFTPKTKVIV